jgi:hypothetical protein
MTERERLTPLAKQPRAKLAIAPAIQADDWDISGEYENRKLIEASRRVKELEHELRTKEDNLRNVIKEAARQASIKGANEASRKYEFRLKEQDMEIDRLKRANLEAGTEIICYECGCILDVGTALDAAEKGSDDDE